ncbi:hypothetical protein SK803_21145 [Lentzea sp. BCCO 10_0856]|uniref:LppA-like lipoprotein n=1 Tax=Lentzea miocenica TaxID=3095431 RepID=A0ABU4T3J0_9PSEU|nr:hypothetical protein [Lentzea sp. BCCO 10_0856]MDX8032730.1 hypothetical protein [Lentzea sp. BCCO 10_0856]
MRVLLALFVAGSVALAVVIARAEPAPDPARGVDGIAAWLNQVAGDCTDVRKGEDFAAFAGPVRAKVYGPFVAEWGTCAKPPYEQLGLLVLRPGLEEAWRGALARGEVRGDPDLVFGDGFAITGSTGMEHLGLKRLECTPAACALVQIKHH